MSSSGSVWFTADEIAQLKGISYTYVRNLASLHKWRRTNTRPRRYHIHDVIESLTSAK